MKETEIDKQEIEFCLEVRITGRESLQRFAYLLHLLSENGYKETVLTLVRNTIEAARAKGVEVPADVLAFIG